MSLQALIISPLPIACRLAALPFCIDIIAGTALCSMLARAKRLNRFKNFMDLIKVKNEIIAELRLKNMEFI